MRKSSICFITAAVMMILIAGDAFVGTANASYGQAEVYDQSRTFSYVLRSKKKKDKKAKTRRKKIIISMDSGYYNYLSVLPAQTCQGCTLTERELITINDAEQKARLNQLVDKIRRATKKPDDRARIAISLVQKIAYDDAGYAQLVAGVDRHAKHPYEVLYTGSGICSEKSQLLSFLLKELGFGVAKFIYYQNLHEAVGIKCPVQYSHQGTGYCFVETNYPRIITYPASRTAMPDVIIPISDGLSFNSLGPKEYKDAQKWKGIIERADPNGNMTTRDRKSYNALIKKYGL